MRAGAESHNSNGRPLPAIFLYPDPDKLRRALLIFEKTGVDKSSGGRIRIRVPAPVPRCRAPQTGNNTPIGFVTSGSR